MDKMLSEAIRHAARRVAGWRYRGTARRLYRLARWLAPLPPGSEILRAAERDAAIELTNLARLAWLMGAVAAPGTFGRTMHRRIAAVVVEAMREAGYGHRWRRQRREAMREISELSGALRGMAAAWDDHLETTGAAS